MVSIPAQGPADRRPVGWWDVLTVQVAVPDLPAELDQWQAKPGNASGTSRGLRMRVHVNRKFSGSVFSVGSQQAPHFCQF